MKIITVHTSEKGRLLYITQLLWFALQYGYNQDTSSSFYGLSLKAYKFIVEQFFLRQERVLSTGDNNRQQNCRQTNEFAPVRRLLSTINLQLSQYHNSILHRTADEILFLFRGKYPLKAYRNSADITFWSDYNRFLKHGTLSAWKFIQSTQAIRKNQKNQREQ